MTKIENQDFNTLVENFFKVNNKITQIQKIPLSFQMELNYQLMLFI